MIRRQISQPRQKRVGARAAGQGLVGALRHIQPRHATHNARLRTITATGPDR